MKRLTALTFLLVFATLTPSTSAFGQKPKSKAANATGLGSPQTISYGSKNGQSLLLWTPATAGPHPWVVFVHGGGWTSGKAEVGEKIAAGLVPKGYAVASVEYRKPPAVTAQETTQDVADGIAYLQKNAKRLHLQEGAFSVEAHSAGSQMIALVVDDPKYAAAAGLDMTQLKVAGTLDGVFDLNTIMGESSQGKQDHELDVFGKSPEALTAMSPVHYVPMLKIHPVFCIIHEDKVSAYNAQSEEYAKVLRDNHEHLMMSVEHGFSHVQLMSDFANPGGAVATAYLGCLAAAGEPPPAQ